MIKITKEDKRGKQPIVVIFFNDIVRIVFTKFKQDALLDLKKLMLNSTMIFVERVKIYECAQGYPKEGKGVKLKVRQESES